MKRRVLAGAAATALAVTLVPATPAFASAAATAALTGATAVYPGDRTFTISVTNNEMPLVGKTINAIRVNLPVNEAGIRLGSGAGTAAGCTEATQTNLGSTQFITYRGCALRPGSSVAITFPTVVGAPLAKDLVGDFRVAVSSDNFVTSKPAAGSLLAKVQVLEILQEGLRPLTPTNAGNTKGVTDRTGTARQAITYGSTVKNYSRSPLSVTTALTSAAGDTVTPATISVPAGGTANASIPVTLSDVAGGRTFGATAVATGAEAPGKTDTFTVQAPATFTPAAGFDGTRTKSGAGSARDFTVTLNKAGAQAVDVFGATLEFGTNRCALVGAPTFAAGSSSQALTFRCAAIEGPDGTFPAQIVYSLTDDNIASYGGNVGLGNIVIDNLSPILDLVVSLPNDADGDKQTAVSNGDAITVSGNVRNASDLAGNTVRVLLTPDAGDAVVINAPVSGSGDTRTFSGSASPSWAQTATRFTSSAQASDTAGNDGGFQLPGSTVIDNVAPVLINPGTIVNTSTIEVTFTDATGVRGGCTANMWRVDGQPGRVSEVRTADGKPCAETTSGTRQLVLSSPLTADDTPTVTYDPTAGRVLQNRRPAKDGAGTDALQATIDTITRLVPAAPQIVSLDRRDGAAGAAFEPAYLDAEDGRYYTNVGGTDALRLTVAGVKQNYTVEVLRAGQVVASRKYTTAPSLGASSYNGEVLVPLGATDGPTGFVVRLVSAQGNAGLGTEFTVVLDRVLPALGAESISGNTVSQPFSEKIVLGSDFADNWFVSETVAGENGPVRRTVNVDTVTADGATTRTLQVSLLDPSRFDGVDYFQQSGTRYEDRAGNTLANTLTLVS